MDATVKRKIETFFVDYPLRRFDKGEILVRPEETLKNVFLITEGLVTQYDISAAGNEIIVNVFKRDAFFPMSMAINQAPNYYFFEAANSVTVRVAPVKKVVDFLQTNPDVMFDLLSRVYKGTDGLLRRMAHLMGGSARTRLLFELLNAAYRFGQHDSTQAIHISLTENDLAKRSGLSRETISRTIRKLKSEGLIQIDSTGLIVTNIDSLEAMLGTDL